MKSFVFEKEDFQEINESVEIYGNSGFYTLDNGGEGTRGSFIERIRLSNGASGYYLIYFESAYNFSDHYERWKSGVHGLGQVEVIGWSGKYYDTLNDALNAGEHSDYNPDYICW